MRTMNAEVFMKAAKIIVRNKYERRYQMNAEIFLQAAKVLDYKNNNISCCCYAIDEIIDPNVYNYDEKEVVVWRHNFVEFFEKMFDPGNHEAYFYGPMIEKNQLARQLALLFAYEMVKDGWSANLDGI